MPKPKTMIDFGNTTQFQSNLFPTEITNLYPHLQIKKVKCGRMYTAMIGIDGGLWTFGNNAFGI
jgi:alpha-tubulin suppressor-like RCC1 family protein